MTEIPEHLLKRSRERRQALGLEGGGSDAPSTGAEAAPAEETEAAPSSAPAPASGAPPAPVEPSPPPAPKPEPVPISVAAARQRKRVPLWAMPVLVVLPLWGWLYWQTMEPPPPPEDGPLAQGEELYTQCAVCHGPTGGGGVGPALADGAVLRTWPDAADHIEWVELGSDNWPEETYGAEEKPKEGGMPGFEGTLTEEEIALVVRYERQTFGLEPPEEACTITEEFFPESCDNPEA